MRSTRRCSWVGGAASSDASFNDGDGSARAPNVRTWRYFAVSISAGDDMDDMNDAQNDDDWVYGNPPLRRPPAVRFVVPGLSPTTIACCDESRPERPEPAGYP